MLQSGDPRSGLLERDVQLAELHALLDDSAKGSGRLAVVEGSAGIGKSRLIAALRGGASGRELAVLSARGSELETEFPFGLVRQLFEPALALAGESERRELLGDAAALARSVLVEAPDLEETDVDPAYGVLHGLYWLTSNLAERTPLLLLVDDLHWSDFASLRFLAFLAHRIDGLPALLVVAMRPEVPKEPARAAIFDAIRSASAAAAIHLSALSESAVGEMLERRLDEPVDERMRQAANDVTRGNPFLVGELGQEMVERRGDDADLDAAAIEQLAPARIAASVVGRLGRMAAGAVAFANAVAVLGDGADPALVEHLAGLDDGEANVLGAELRRAAVLDSGRPLRFRHPVVRSSIYEAIEEQGREKLHARAAALLEQAGAPPESIAAHLMHTSPNGDEEIVSKLRAAASIAFRRGAPRVAMELLARAMDEPPANDSRGAILLEIAQAARAAGDPTVVDRYEEVFAATADPDARTTAAAELGETMSTMGRDADAVRILAAAITEAREAERNADVIKLRSVLLVLANATAGTRRFAAEEMQATIVEVDASDSPHPALAAHVAIELANGRGPGERAAELGRYALEAGLIRMAGVDGPLPYLASGALWIAGHHREADRWLTTILDEARGRGSAVGFALASGFRSVSRWRVGDLDGAQADAEAVMELGGAGGWATVALPVAASASIATLVARGELEAADGLAAVAADAPIPEDLALFQHLRYAIAELRSAQGRLGDALTLLDQIAEFDAEWGGTSGAWSWWRSGAALVCWRQGDRGRAQKLASDEVAHARSFGARPYLGASLRVAGMVGATEDPGATLTESVEVLRASEARLELAKSLLAQGAATRRGGADREARDLLREAGELAARCGATAVEHDAREELVAAGGRPRVPPAAGRDVLTPAETRVARLAAEGQSNREIAQTLFITLKTVETHLSRAYRKLEISSRAQLPDRLAATAPPAVE